MIIVKRLEDIPPLSPPIALTIGTFDGVHLGHQQLLSELKKRGYAALLTFSNHPAEILRPQAVPPLIDTLDQKLRRLEACGVDLAIVLPFTPDLASLPYDIFLQQLHDHLPFSSLVLGEGAVLGHGGRGTAENIGKLSQAMAFEAIYLPKLSFEGESISSRKIRALIEAGDFQQALRLLGRPKERV